MQAKYADIIIDISHEAIDRTFQYLIPDEIKEELFIGMQVIVPFGKGNATRKGYIIGFSNEPSFDPDKTKAIIGISGKGLAIEGKLISLAYWMKENYGGTMNHALMTVMPVKESVKTTASRTEEIVYELNNPPVDILCEEQRKLVEDFKKDNEDDIRKTYLLHGVTGSGKTEVYVECIKEIIKKKKQAILLIPEIALTYQNVARFKQHFGDRVAFINSRQSKGEKYRAFMQAKAGEVDVVIGPRSALFTPCKNLGLIIIDEEHDSAYKSDQTPKYHARETAIERARLEDASVILGSATPSMESYMMAKMGKYKLWELKNRPNSRQMSNVSIVDLRDELHMGNRSIISNKLKEMIQERLEKKEQIMLFINRRGYNTFVSCRECGEVVKCPKCDVSLSLHNKNKNDNMGYMVCHYCGYIEREPKQCKKCKSNLIGGFGTGTEKVEEEVKKQFPGVRTLRMDKDTTTKKGAHEAIIRDFVNHKADILIGTQMIVKGHDFSNVTLVGVMLADMSLFSGDFMASERTFDLLTQAAGRAGRGDLYGDVVIQTYQPEHYAIVAAAKQDYEGFFDMEISYRRLLHYPPVYHMMVILMTSASYENLVEESQIIAKKINELKANKLVGIIGPSDAIISKINDVFRRVIYVKTKDISDITSIKNYIDAYEKDGISIAVDIDPMNTY